MKSPAIPQKYFDIKAAMDRGETVGKENYFWLMSYKRAMAKETRRRNKSYARNFGSFGDPNRVPGSGFSNQ